MFDENLKSRVSDPSSPAPSPPWGRGNDFLVNYDDVYIVPSIARYFAVACLRDYFYACEFHSVSKRILIRERAILCTRAKFYG